MSPKFLPFITIFAFVTFGGCIFLGALWFVDHKKLQTEVDTLQNSVVQERQYKSDLQELLDRNLNAGSELVQATSDFSAEVADFTKNVENSFRIIDGRTELLPGANGKILQTEQSQLKIDQENVEFKINNSIKEKDNANNKINEIFGSSNQNLQNRADPKDGVKK